MNQSDIILEQCPIPKKLYTTRRNSGTENLEILKSEKYQISTLEHVGINGRMDLENLVKNGAATRCYSGGA